MSIFGFGKKSAARPYDEGVPIAASSVATTIQFDELEGGDYKITATKGDKNAAYIVTPNNSADKKGVIEAIVNTLGSTGPTTEPTEPIKPPTKPPTKPITEPPTGPPTEPTPELQALNAAVDELIAGITDSGKINTATDKITTATGAITVADKDAAISKVTEAIAAVDKALTPVTGAAPASESLISVLENAKKALLAANETLNKLVELAPPAPAGGYNSAKSAVPKRITRMRRTRRSAKLAGTRRRRRLTR